MSDPRSGSASGGQVEGVPEEAPMYPVHHLVGVVDTTAAAASAVAALAGAGIPSDDMHFWCGKAAGDALDASPGRTGIAGIAVRIAKWLGVADSEMAMKDRYEQAMRDGHCMVVVHAETDERKTLAARVLREHGGHLINYLGRLTIEVMHP